MLRTLSFGELTTGLIVEHTGEFIQAESMTRFDKRYMDICGWIVDNTSV